MEKEIETLKNLQEIPGVIKVKDSFKINVSEIEVNFAIMELFEHGDLAKFLKSKDASKMTIEQKKEFTKQLLNIFVGVHKNKHIHRDVKKQNILIGKENDKFRPVLIDFETCVLESEKESHKDTVSTLEYWPLEYINAYLNGFNEYTNTELKKSNENENINLYIYNDNKKTDKIDEKKKMEHINNHIANATSQAMDIWSLGLVFFEFVYGQDLIKKVLKFDINSTNDIEQCNSLKNVLETKLNTFLLAMDPTNKNTPEDWTDIKGKINANDESEKLWNLIIKPMLNNDPESRPTAEALMSQFNF